MISKSAIKMLEIHSFASSACRIYPCKGATWAVTIDGEIERLDTDQELFPAQVGGYGRRQCGIGVELLERLRQVCKYSGLQVVVVAPGPCLIGGRTGGILGFVF